MHVTGSLCSRLLATLQTCTRGNFFGQAMNVVRIRHLENAINHFEKSVGVDNSFRCSIESHLRSYHAAHKSQLSKVDKEWLSDKFKDIYRWKSLIDHFSMEPRSVANLLRVYLGDSNWRAYAHSKVLPEHTRLSLPTSLFEALSKQYGKEKAREIAGIYNESTPVFLRVNRRVSSRDEVLKVINGAGIPAEASSHSETGLKVSRSPKLVDLDILKTHACEFQDEAFQIVGKQISDLILSTDSSTPVKVLDFCAGSGGKSLVFGPTLRGKGHLFINDVNMKYLHQARMKMKAAKIPNFTAITDPSQLNRLRGKMDFVLVDPPSTSSGQYRRYPERKWLYSEEASAQSVIRQQEIFKQALQYLKRDGKIIYSVSSILSCETWEQLKFFCDNHKLFLSYEPVHSLPVSHGMDGFFCAIMERQSRKIN